MEAKEAMEVLINKKKEIEELCMNEINEILKKYKCKIETEILISRNQITPFVKVISEKLD